MTLGDYLLSQRGVTWQAGTADCCTLPAGWVETWGSGDPMTAWRGLYATDEEAEALVTASGGLLAMWEAGMAGKGEPTEALREGDVGVIRAVALSGEATEVGAIWTGRRWAFRVPAGLCFASAETVKAWTRG